MSQACDPRPACASQLLSVISLASLQLGSIQYACCWQSSVICFSVHVACCILKTGNGMYLLLCVLLHLSLPCAWMRAYGLLGGCLGKLWQLDKGTQCTEDHVELIARGREGGGGVASEMGDTQMEWGEMGFKLES